MSRPRAPLLHFLVLGGLLFAAEALVAPRSGGGPSVFVSAARVAQLEAELKRDLGRAPSTEELRWQIDRWIEEELLVGAAIARGWSRDDPVVQRRLIQNARFLGEEGEPEALLDSALALGMDRSDIVARRRLVERMKLEWLAAARAEEPAPGELEALLREQPERFRRPARVALTQIYLSRDRRGDALAADAGALLGELVADGVAPEEALRRGDPFLVPARLPAWSERELSARLGPEFARAALAAPVGRWSGPHRSAYGLHLVWVHERQPSRLPGLEEARRALLQAWRAERERATLRERIAGLRAGATIRVESDPGSRPQAPPSL